MSNRKVYFTGILCSSIVDPIKKSKILSMKKNFEPGNSEKGYIEEDISAEKCLESSWVPNHSTVTD